MSRILVVDDNADALEAICAFLGTLGYTVACEGNGRKALEEILNATPDLVILDLVMPGMDGCGLLEIVRSYLRLRTLPVIVLTGVRDGPLLDRARVLKPNAIFLKGKATLEEIADAVHVHLKRSKK